MSAASEWLENADPRFVAFLKRLTFHHQVKWSVPDYVEGVEDHRQVTEDIEETEAFSSRLKPYPWDDPDADDHALLLDLDIETFSTPSSRPGHTHLWVNLPHGVPAEHLWEFMEVAVKIGMIEEGYYKACKERGMLSLRAPWVKKEAGDG